MSFAISALSRSSNGTKNGLLADTVAAMVSMGSTQPINTPGDGRQEGKGERGECGDGRGREEGRGEGGERRVWERGKGKGEGEGGRIRGKRKR